MTDVNSELRRRVIVSVKNEMGKPRLKGTTGKNVGETATSLQLGKSYELKSLCMCNPRSIDEGWG